MTRSQDGPRLPYVARFYAITRRQYGWVVRLVRDHQRFERSFSDRAYGGESKALIHATNWRNQIVREHPPLARREKVMRPRGGSGPIPGVTPELDKRGRVTRWRAKTYVSSGTILQKTFSVAVYGCAAEQLAMDERRRQLEFVKGLSWVHPAEHKLRSSAPARRALPVIPERVPANQIARSTNSSGFPGVVRRTKYWTAQTTIGGKWVSQSFRVDRHGEEVALILAVWARLDQLKNDGSGR